MYHLTLARSAEKELAHIPEPHQSAILHKLEKLTGSPFPSGVKKIQGTDNAWRIRIGNYRVIYEVDESSKTLDISAIGHRKEIYR